MLKKNQLGHDDRLHSPKSFQHVYKNARKFRYQGICVLVCVNNVTCSRLGVSISKRQIKRAVDRNRIKRLIRECFRVNKNELGICLDMVFSVYSSLLELNNSEIIACLELLWTKVITFYERG